MVNQMSRPLRVHWLLSMLSLLAVAAACGGGNPAPPPTGDNIFGNPSFEDDQSPWFSLKPPEFVLSDDVSHSGNTSAFLPFRADQSEVDNKIYYLVQEVEPQEFPEVISGYYRVDEWEKGTPKQYLQFVVIVFGGDNPPENFTNHQIRYLLAGIDAPPFGIANARFVFLTKEEPQTSQWVHFERNLREDFQQFWGAVPQNFDKIRVLFEVRYDDKAAGEGPVSADVYYDDLYMGPAPAP